jgi:hypothetical protein
MNDSTSNTDEAVEHVKSLGDQVLHGPMITPGIVRVVPDTGAPRS